MSVSSPPRVGRDKKNGKIIGAENRKNVRAIEIRERQRKREKKEGRGKGTRRTRACMPMTATETVASRCVTKITTCSYLSVVSGRTHALTHRWTSYVSVKSARECERDGK